MRYRRMDPDYDYVFGNGGKDFYVDSVAAVAQAILTRLRLIEGEWFLDLREGLPLYTQIIGRNTYGLYDNAIKSRVKGTSGVKTILRYQSQLNPDVRHLQVAMVVNTIYGLLGIQTGFGVEANRLVLATESGFILTTESGAPLSIGA